MKTTIHKASERGFFDYGWLKTHHSFSFSGYFRPDRMNFGMLRVLNDDIVAPGKGFGTHPHDNMEIVSIALSGSLAHKDSMGYVQTISSGEVQAMSAGTGITHSEFNASDESDVNFLQIWIIPAVRDVEPAYDQKKFDSVNGRLKLLVSQDGSEGSLRINQNAHLSRGSFEAGDAIDYDLSPGRGVYLFLVEGLLTTGDVTLERRDGLGITETERFSISFPEKSDLLLIELPME